MPIVLHETKWRPLQVPEISLKKSASPSVGAGVGMMRGGGLYGTLSGGQVCPLLAALLLDHRK